MEAGFDTIGNATIICYDRKPLLVTDPWITGSAYFGSWNASHRIPDEQMEAIKACPYVWISHGHPDHLNAGSLGVFRDKTILLPNHHGGRIRRELEAQGYLVQVLEDRVWLKVSDGIKVMCISDYFQDAILLIDINGRLLVNTNDAIDRGWGRFVRKIIKSYPTSFLLALSGFGDADMINFYGENGVAISPVAALRLPVGRTIAQRTESFGVKYFIPFSSMHKYQREDSVWANRYITSLTDYAVGFESKTSKILPAFIRYDCARDTYTELRPPEVPVVVVSPGQFGDNWSEPLERDEVAKVERYFRAISHLEMVMDYLNIRVGGKNNLIEFRKSKFQRGITFEAPRHSLMTAIEHQVFDDMLIGNFMKTTLHGSWPKTGLYPDFTPYVAKYADNGGARNPEEVEAYLQEYKRRALLDYLRHRCEERSRSIFRRYVDQGSQVYQFTKRIYWIVKRFEGEL